MNSTNRDEWYDYFANFRPGMTIGLQVSQCSTLRNMYIGKIVGTLNTRRSLLERWIVQVNIVDLSDRTTKTAYIDSQFGRTEFYFRDNHSWRPQVIGLEIA